MRQWHYVLLRERLSTRQRLISNDADGIEIVINGCRLAANPVGTHVRQRADDMTSRRVDRRSGLHNPEIGNFDGARWREQQVTGLDVTMQHSRIVRDGKSREHAAQRRTNLRLRERSERYLVAEGVARQSLHHDERSLVVVADVIHPDNVGVVESRRRARLDFEPLPDVGLRAQTPAKEFDGHGAAQAGVPAVTHFGRSTETQHVANFVASAK